MATECAVSKKRGGGACLRNSYLRLAPGLSPGYGGCPPVAEAVPHAEEAVPNGTPNRFSGEAARSPVMRVCAYRPVAR
jgi:hypothetical protein